MEEGGGKETVTLRALHRNEEGRKCVEKVEVRTHNPDTLRYVDKKLRDKGIQRMDRHPSDGIPLNQVPKSGRGGKYTWEGPEGIINNELDPAPAAIDSGDPNYLDDQDDEENTDLVVGEVDVAKMAESREGVSRVDVPQLQQRATTPTD